MIRRLLSFGLLFTLLAGAASCQSPSLIDPARPGPAGHAGVPRGTAAEPARPPQSVPAPSANSIRREPSVRVRIAAEVSTTTIAAASPLVIGPIASQRNLSQPRSFMPPVTIARQGGRFMLTDGHRQTIAWGLPALEIRTASGDTPITVDGKAYPGELAVWPVVLRDGTVTSRLDVVNHVPMERYLPGVLERELYGSWHQEAFAAQAIAARTYAIVQMSLHTGRHYDLESTTASQVYGGEATSPKAALAARATRGQVLVYNGRLVPAFFSSTSGGVGQDATIAFPDTPFIVDIPPLRGRTHGWGQSSTSYRWGPIERRTHALSQRIAAWGRANRNAVAGLDTLSRVDVVQRSGTGRPAVFQLTDTRGQRFQLPAEWFRFACNYAGGGAPTSVTLTASDQLKSSNVDVQVRGDRVMFTNGRGYGHGVGLCQWSASEMAAQGHSGQAIVTFFYPGASVQRVY